MQKSEPAEDVSCHSRLPQQKLPTPAARLKSFAELPKGTEEPGGEESSAGDRMQSGWLAQIDSDPVPWRIRVVFVVRHDVESGRVTEAAVRLPV